MIDSEIEYGPDPRETKWSRRKYDNGGMRFVDRNQEKDWRCAARVEKDRTNQSRRRGEWTDHFHCL